MIGISKPALRHFAVLSRKSRSLAGSVWMVQDRRNPQRRQFLFLPSRLKSWPVWIKRLESLKSTPVRLRNGQVGVLVFVDDYREIEMAIKASKGKSTLALDALKGFEETSSKRRISKVSIGLSLSLLPVLLFLPRPPVSNSEPTTGAPIKTNHECQMRPAIGFQFSSQVSKLSQIEFEGEKFKVASMTRFGGLAQMKLKRICDSKYFRIDAWKSGKQFEIEQVY